MSAPIANEAAIASAQYRRRRRSHRSGGHLRPRVLQLLATGGAGGAQESYTGLLLRLDRARYDVSAVSLGAGSAVARLRRLGVNTHVIDEADDARAVARLAERLRRDEIDLLHTHMYRAEVVGTRAAAAAGTPVVIATVHSSRVRAAGDVETLRQLTPMMDRLIVPSASIETKAREEGRQAAITVIPNGVPLERFADPPPPDVRARLGVPENALLIGAVGRLEPEKGHRYLLDALPAVLARCPDAWLVVVGEGSLLAELRERADALDGAAGRRVVFTGRREDVAAITAALDVAVVPSLREAQGIAILEAMAAGRPVVASAVGGIPEVIEDGRTGLLVPPRDAEALAAAILRLALDPALARRIGDAGRGAVEERYTLEAMVRRVEDVYDEELVKAGVPVTARRAARAEAVPPGARGAEELSPGA